MRERERVSERERKKEKHGVRNNDSTKMEKEREERNMKENNIK